MGTFTAITMAFEAVLANRLRSSLTLVSIAMGVFAIIASGSIVESLNSSVATQLASLGANTFTIDREPHMGVSPEEWERIQKRKPITYRQAADFKSRMEPYTSGISITNITGGEVLKYGNIKTDQDVAVLGADFPYFELNTRDIESGRPLSDEDVALSRRVVVLGKDIALKLFDQADPIGKEITIRSQRFQVVGIMKPKGSSFGNSMDKFVVVPISYYMRTFADQDDRSVTLDIKAISQDEYAAVTDQSIGLMRILRNVQPGEDNDFEIITNESLTNQFEGFTGYIDIFGYIIGGIALLAAGIGIINMMLVSVKERTREIGVRKALGARSNTILSQFIMEAIALCLLGCSVGIALGMLGGLAVGALMGAGMVWPIMNIVYSLLFCTFIGVVFGAYPAWRASQLDPIETLRYE